MKAFEFVDVLCCLILFKNLFGQENVLFYFMIKDCASFVNSVVGLVGIAKTGQIVEKPMMLVNLLFNIMGFFIVTFFIDFSEKQNGNK